MTDGFAGLNAHFSGSVWSGAAVVERVFTLNTLSEIDEPTLSPIRRSGPVPAPTVRPLAPESTVSKWPVSVERLARKPGDATDGLVNISAWLLFGQRSAHSRRGD